MESEPTSEEMKEDRATMDRLLKGRLESVGQEGVYYVLPFPTRWRLYAFPWDNLDNLSHRGAWRRYVVDDLAETWAGIIQIPVEELKKQLVPFWKGVPHGRVKRLAVREFTIFHADDLACTGTTQERIQNTFELFNSKVVWSFDPDEQQIQEHQSKLRELLRFK